MQIPAILSASKSKYKQDFYALKYLGMRLWKKQTYYTMNAKKEKKKKKPKNRKKITSIRILCPSVSRKEPSEWLQGQEV